MRSRRELDERGEAEPARGDATAVEGDGSGEQVVSRRRRTRRVPPMQNPTIPRLRRRRTRRRSRCPDGGGEVRFDALGGERLHVRHRAFEVVVRARPATRSGETATARRRSSPPSLMRSRAPLDVRRDAEGLLDDDDRAASGRGVAGGVEVHLAVRCRNGRRHRCSLRSSRGSRASARGPRRQLRRRRTAARRSGGAATRRARGRWSPARARRSRGTGRTGTAGERVRGTGSTPPSPTKPGSLPKTSVDARASESRSHGSSGGATQPSACVLRSRSPSRRAAAAP